MKSQQQQLRAAAPSLPPDRLLHLILKLRWIGMDDEADKLSVQLGRLQSNAEIVIGTPETD